MQDVMSGARDTRQKKKKKKADTVSARVLLTVHQDDNRPPK